MKRRALAIILGALSIGHASSPAFAADPVIARLQSATQGAAKPVAGGAVFECLGDVCAARAPGADTAGLRGCKELVRQMGPVSSYGPASRTFSADRIAECNTSAKN